MTRLPSPTKRPLRAKSLSLFGYLRGTGKDSGCNATSVYSKTRKEEDDELDYEWVRKHFDKAELAEIEAAMAAVNALFEPKHIPKVRAVYEAGKTDSFDSLSKSFPDFIHLEAFLAGGTDKEKKDFLISRGIPERLASQLGFTEEKKAFLISHGLPEVLAVSLFTEEDDAHKKNIGIYRDRETGELIVCRIDFDMSAYSIVSRETFRGPRLRASSSAERSFLFTRHDIDYFPVLADAKPGYWPTFGWMVGPSYQYSDREAKMFSSLSDSEKFQARAYRTFLKPVLVPDKTIENTLANYITKPETLRLFQKHFLARKQNLKKELFSSIRFLSWWEKTSQAEIEPIFKQFEAHNAKLKPAYENEKIDMDEVRSAYYAFCCETTCARVEDAKNKIVRADPMNAVVLQINDVIRIAKEKVGTQYEMQYSMGMYESLCAVKEIVWKEYFELFQKEKQSEENIAQFVERVGNVVNAVRRMLFSTDANRTNQLISWCDNMRAQLEQLKKYHFCLDDSWEKVDVCRVTFENAPEFQAEELVKKTLEWIFESRNASTMVKILDVAHREVEEKGGKDWSLSSLSSWAFRAASSAVVTQTPPVDFEVLSDQLVTATEEHEICAVLNKIIASANPAKTDGLDVSTKFVLNMIRQCAREHRATHVMEQLKMNPSFAMQLNLQPPGLISDGQAAEYFAIFKRHLAEKCLEFEKTKEPAKADDDEWVEVDGKEYVEFPALTSVRSR